MRIPRLAALFAALPVALVSSAYAEEVFASDLIEIVPPGSIRAGQGPVVIRVLARNTDGSATTGLKLTPTSSAGKVAKWQEIGDGWYSFRFTPPEVSKPVSVDLGLQGQNQASRRVLILPVAEGTIEVVAKPANLVLRQASTATVTFRLPAGQRGPIKLLASSGSLQDLTDMGDNTYSARYTLPQVNYPHLALITAVSASQPEVFGVGQIELRGAVDFPVTGVAGASVVLSIDGQDYGPVRIGDDGKALVPIVVSPGVITAKRIDIQDGDRTESTLDLQLPATRRIAWIPSTGVPLSGGAVRFVVRTPTGDPDETATPTIEIPGGTVTAPRHIGKGVYEALFTPSAAGTIRLVAKIGPEKVDAATLEIQALPDFPEQPGNWPAPNATGAPAMVVVVPRMNERATGAATSVVVAAIDAYGHPIPNTTLSLSSTHGTVPDQVDTGTHGVGTIELTGGDSGLSVITARVDHLQSASSVLAPPLGLHWPASHGMQGRWEQLVPQRAADAVVAPTPPKPEPVPEPAVLPPEPSVPAEPASPSEHRIPKLRLRVGFAGGSYQYAQRPSNDPGPLLPGAFLFGGADGGSSAPLVGFDTDLRAWVIPYLGLDLGFRTTSYGIESSVFSSPIRDVLVHGRAHLTGRYPIPIQSNQLWFGVQAGFQIDDFLVLRGECLDPGCQITYDSIFLPGLEVGASAGGEFGPVFFVASFNQGLVRGSIPYRLGVDADVGFEVHKNVFVDLGGALVSRQLLLKGDTSDRELGQLSDLALVGRASLGVQF